MFQGATNFNQPILKNNNGAYINGENTSFNWYTVNVTNMASMFQNASSFNQVVNNWTTYNVNNMNDMFAGAIKFNNGGTVLVTNNNLEWNTSNVTSMSGMFFGATVFNVSVDHWDVSKVTSMRYMFAEARAFNHFSINNWRPSNLVDASYMFMRAVAFDQSLSGWNESVSKLQNMNQMFYGTTNFNQNLSGWLLNTLQTYNGGAYSAGVYYGFNDFGRPMAEGNRPYEYRGTSNIRFNRNVFTNVNGFPTL